MRRGMILPLVAVCVLFSIVGCARTPTPGPSEGPALGPPSSSGATTAPDTSDGAVPAGDNGAKAPTPVTVRVPNVLGLWPDEATEALEAVGLTVTEVSVHGPIEPDAGDIGRVYRQTPPAGADVPLGTAVEIRYWWESQ